MIDYFKIKILIKAIEAIISRENSPQIINGIIFYPLVRKGVVIKYTAKFENLYLSIREDELTIQNSLNKFYHGNNYTNFSYTELQQTIVLIENLLGFPIRGARIISFEFGVVIEDNNIPLTLSRFGHYKGKPPVPMHTNGVIYGTRYANNCMVIKIYDKTSEIKRREGVQLNKNYLRVEKLYMRSHINSISCLKDNPINTLDDLASWKTLEILSQDLVSSLTKIELKPIPELIEDMSPNNLRRWCYLQDPYIRNLMKLHHHKAYKTDLKVINIILKDYCANGHNQMIEEVKNKLEYCLNN